MKIGLAEDTTEEIEDDRDVVKKRILDISQVLSGKEPGCIEEELVVVGIIDALATFHSWNYKKVRRVYKIDVTHDGEWNVVVDGERK